MGATAGLVLAAFCFPPRLLIGAPTSGSVAKMQIVCSQLHLWRGRRLPAFMKTQLAVLTFIVSASLLPCCPAVAATIPADANTTCPVMTSEDADPDVFIEHEGQKVFFCCTKCKSAFSKNPDKYMKNLLGGKDMITSSPKHSASDTLTSAGTPVKTQE
jgi:YHS domain-containing protein